MLDEVCTSVQKEPMLQPLTGEPVCGNLAGGAKLDVSAVGFWRPSERMFADVRVFDQNSTTFKNTAPVKVYGQHGREKKNEYLDRVINVERPHSFFLQLAGKGSVYISQTVSKANS